MAPRVRIADVVDGVSRSSVRRAISLLEAPEYLVKSATPTLSAERVVTDTTSITWDWTTGGQAKAKRAALTGDVTASADSNATTIADAAVTLAKMANLATDRLIGRDAAGTGAPEALTVGNGLEFTGSGGIGIAVRGVTLARMDDLANQRIVGRNTAGTGAPEAVTLSQLLDWVGSAANGDVLIRSGGAWTRLAIGSADQVLTVSGGLPAWVSPVAWDATFTGTASTTDATVTTCGTYTVPDLSTILVTVNVAAVRDTHAQGAGYMLIAAFRRNGGTVTQIGVTTVSVAVEDDVLWDATLDISSTSIRVRVTGVAATNINWRARGTVVAAS